jgi:serine/threonine-protein kinase
MPKADSTPRAGGGAGAGSDPSGERRGSRLELQQRLGRYRVLFRLASGGMGSVYAAVLAGAHGVERTVAIKVLSSRDRTPEDVAAFVQEAKVTARISHPNVLETFELGAEEGEPFIVMPLVRGVSLARLLSVKAAAGETIDVDMAAWIAMQVATGLHAAHELRDEDGTPLLVVHRDVSPQNVLLSYEGRVLLVDFGVAKLFEATRATASGVIKGKFGYMAPEQISGAAVDRRTDLFALGVVLHEMLTGRRLYAQLPPAQAMFRIASDPVPHPGDVVPSLPEEMDAIVARCLAKKPEDRYASALELRDVLRAFLRARGASLDESDLATLLGPPFAEERAALEQRIRAAVAGKLEEPPPAPAPELPISQGSKVSMTTSALQSQAVPRSRAGLVVPGLGLIAGVAIAIVGARAAGVFGGPASATRPEPAHEPSVSVATTSPSAVESASVASERSPVVSASAAPHSPTAIARLAAEPVPRRPAVRLPTAKPTAAASQAPPAASSTHRGVPFRDL